MIFVTAKERFTTRISKKRGVKNGCSWGQGIPGKVGLFPWIFFIRRKGPDSLLKQSDKVVQSVQVIDVVGGGISGKGQNFEFSFPRFAYLLHA